MANGQHFGKICIITLSLLLFGVTSNCPPGKFGWKCNVECKCKTGTSLRCIEATGECQEGCDNDSYGPHCLFEKNCMYDEAGELYTGTVNMTEKGIPCRQWDYINDKAKFLQGDNPQNFCRSPELSGAYSSKPWCYVDRSQNDTSGSDFGFCELQKCSCPKYLFGTGCTKQCHCNMTDEVCDATNGQCKSGCAPGWVGSGCQEKCDTGKYGSGCSQTCEKCDRDDCDPETGVCRSGCVEGFSGIYCNKSCEVGRFGKDCAFLCGNCKDGKECDILTGVCMGCADGYDTSDIMCQTKCIEGKFGAHCSKRCGNCKDGESCHHAKGTCENGCKAGYHGDGCSQQCDDYFYGEGCTHACNCEDNSTCDRASGFCRYGCLDGYSGTHCHMVTEVLQEENEWWIIAVAVVSSVGVLLVVACIVTVCIRRFKSRSVPFIHGRAEDVARNGEAFDLVGVERRITSAACGDADHNDEVGSVLSMFDPATDDDGYEIMEIRPGPEDMNTL